jgi:hypothetical protein
LIDTFTIENKESSLVPNVVYTQPILSLPEIKVFVPKNHEDHLLYSGSSLITSPIYPSIRYERPNSSSHFPYEFDFTSLSREPSPFDYLACLCYYLPKEIKDLVQQSFQIFYNLHYSPSISSPKLSMVDVGGAGGGGNINPPPPPPRIFSKVTARYAPLALPAALHDLPENYMKSLPKFPGEGDLTGT